MKTRSHEYLGLFRRAPHIAPFKNISTCVPVYYQYTISILYSILPVYYHIPRFIWAFQEHCRSLVMHNPSPWPQLPCFWILAGPGERLEWRHKRNDVIQILRNRISSWFFDKRSPRYGRPLVFHVHWMSFPKIDLLSASGVNNLLRSAFFT